MRSARAVASSSSGSGRSRAAAVRIPPGTAAAIRPSSDSWPIASSIRAMSASSGPMWRATNSPRVVDRSRSRSRWRPARALLEVTRMTSHLSARWPPECQPVRSGCLRGSGRNCPFGALRPAPRTGRNDSPARDVGTCQFSDTQQKWTKPPGQRAASSEGPRGDRVVLSPSGGRRGGRRARRRRRCRQAPRRPYARWAARRGCPRSRARHRRWRCRRRPGRPGAGR